MQKRSRDYIINRALERVNNTNLYEIAIDLLDDTLDKLYKEWTWNFLIKNLPVTFAANSATTNAALPDDFYKQFALKIIMITNQEEVTVPWYPYSEFVTFNLLAPSATQPKGWTLLPTFGEGTTQQAQIQIFPSLNIQTNGKFYYYYTPGHLKHPEDIPVFPNPSYLVKCLVNELYGYLHNQKYDELFIEHTIETVRGNLQENALFAQQAPLDARIFRKMKKDQWI